MAKLSPVQFPDGFRSVDSFLRLLTDPKWADELARTTAGLRELADEINEKIRQLGIQSNVDTLLGEARADRQAAKQAVAEAEHKAAEIVAAAREKAEESRRLLKRREAAVVRREDAAAERDQALAAKADRLNAQESALNDREAMLRREIEAELAAAKAAREDFEDRRRRIDAALQPKAPADAETA